MKRLALAVPVALVALALPVAAVAATTPMHLTEKHTFEHVVDKGKKGESAGDIRTFGGFVYRGAAKVGHDQIRCVVGGTCNAQVWIRGGSLIARGFVVSGRTFTAKITDGTGRYAGARGTVKVSTGAVSHYTVAITS